MTAPARARRAAAPSAPNPLGLPDVDMAKDPFIQRIAEGSAAARRMQQSRRDIIEGLKVLSDQRAKALEADEMYDGDVGMIYASRQVKRLLARQGLAETEIDDLNYAKIPVDVIANRLQIAAVKVSPRITDDESDAEDDEATGDDAPASRDTDPDEPDDRNPGDDAATRRSGARAVDRGKGGKVDDKLVKRAERAVKALRRANRLDVYEKALHKNVSQHGDAFLFVWPVKDDRGKVVSVDMRVNSAHDVAFIYDSEDPLQVAYVIKSWETPSDIDDDTGEGQKPVVRVNLYYPGPRTIDADGEIGQGAGRIERWVTAPGASIGKADSWRRLHSPEIRAEIEPDDLEEVAADEFGDPDDPLDKDDIVSPFGLTWFHFRNSVPCGIPEHRSAYGPQKLINKLIWSYAGTIESMGFPQRYIMIDPKVDDPAYNMIDPDHPEDDDDPEGEGNTSGLSADPGTVWKLWGKSTGQYSAADPATFMTPLDRFITSMSELTGLPRYSFTKSSADLPSGEAARELNGEMIATITDRQNRYDPDWQDGYELALRMLGITGVSVDVRWVPVQAVNDLNGLQVLQAKAALGVPSEVLLNEAGYPDELIKRWLKSQEGLSLEQRIALLGQMATAAQGLAPGVTAGIVSDTQTQAMIARIIEMLAVGTKDPDRTPDSLPTPEYRDPPPTDPAAAAAKIAAENPDPDADVKRAQAEAQVEHMKAQADHTRAQAEASRTGTELLRKNPQPQPGAKTKGAQ